MEPIESCSRNQRKEQRPCQIMEAAFTEFALNGYAATRLDHVARRAGITKGTIYLYFESKEELFKAMTRTIVLPTHRKLETLAADFDGTSEELVRRQLMLIYTELVENDRAREILRLFISEGARFPELTEFYFDEVWRRGLAAIAAAIKRGMDSGEFRRMKLEQFPQIIGGPALMATVWKMIFQKHPLLDLDTYMKTHIDLILNGLRNLAHQERAANV